MLKYTNHLWRENAINKLRQNIVKFTRQPGGQSDMVCLLFKPE